MVKLSQQAYWQHPQIITPQTWLSTLPVAYQQSVFIEHTAQFAYLTGEHTLGPGSISCWQHGLSVAESLLGLNVDQELFAAALLYPVWEYADLSLDDIQETLSPKVAALLAGADKMKAVSDLHSSPHKNPAQIENCRKMLLAMVGDLRIVLLKLAERLHALRTAKFLPSEEQKKLGEEIFTVYAPLANRLGLGHLKWELEDLAFRATYPEEYKKIATQLDMKRSARDALIHSMLKLLEEYLSKEKIKKFELMGRAKHIYSIYRKLSRKGITLHDLFDISAVRILVDTIEDCYRALDLVQQHFEMIPHEFDDYISAPKPNGYRSIHTAVYGPNKHIVEIQIRTHQMHQESELGVAAHWRYKEGGKSNQDYEAKIAWLREVLSWQHEIGNQGKNVLADRVYVLTPNSDIIDLPRGATPLDFAYTVHTSLGHRCKGAKINGHIVPLTTLLKMGDRVEILTGKEAHPSRDWLLPKSGYLFTARARAKVASWFRKEIPESEQSLVEVKPKGAMPALQKAPAPAKKATQTKTKHPKILVEGSENLLTHLARCCDPQPGDKVAGYISQRHGVAIHKITCPSFLAREKQRPERVLVVHYG